MFPTTSDARASDARARLLLIATLVALAAVVVGAVTVGRPALAANSTTPEHTISVSGTGTVTISPDIADLRLGVMAQRKTVAEARAAAADAMTGVIAALKKAGIADRDITTAVLSLSPTYDTTPSTTPRIVGYQLTNIVAVTIRNLDTVGPAIDGAMAAGATTMDGVTFRVSDPAGAERQAREQAMADAKSKAGQLASAAGVSIIGVSAISETSGPQPWPVSYAGPLLEGGKATPVQPGTTDVTVTVSVTYLID